MKMVKAILLCILFVIVDVTAPTDAFIRPISRLALREKNNRRGVNRSRRIQYEDQLRMYEMMIRVLVSGYNIRSIRRDFGTNIHQVHSGLSNLPILITLSVGQNSGQREHSHKKGNSIKKKILISNLKSSPSLVTNCPHNYGSWLKSEDYIEVNTESPMNLIQPNYSNDLRHLSNGRRSLFKLISTHLSNLDHSEYNDIGYEYASILL